MSEDLRLTVTELKAAKLQEAIAKIRRIALEEKLIALMPPELKVNEGQSTLVLSDGSKVVTKAGVTVKADIEKIEKLFKAGISDGHHFLAAPIASKTTHALDLKGYEWYKEKHPNIYNKIAEHVTVTPKKIGVELKPAKKEK